MCHAQPAEQTRCKLFTSISLHPLPLIYRFTLIPCGRDTAPEPWLHLQSRPPEQPFPNTQWSCLLSSVFKPATMCPLSNTALAPTHGCSSTAWPIDVVRESSSFCVCVSVFCYPSHNIASPKKTMEQMVLFLKKPWLLRKGNFIVYANADLFWRFCSLHFLRLVLCSENAARRWGDNIAGWRRDVIISTWADV